MSNVRLRRLAADYEKLRQFVQGHPRLKLIQTDGEPPERYQIHYQVKSLRQTGDVLGEIHEHLVEIALPRSYPRMPPVCRMLTPVFHPNIAPHAICVGDHWSAGEPLWAIVARIGEMIAYQSYNTKSPLNGEAARWVDQNLDRLPLDAVNMMFNAAENASSMPATAPPPPARPQIAAPAPPPLAAPIAPNPRQPIDANSPSAVAAAMAAAAENSPEQKIVVQCPSCMRNYQIPPITRRTRLQCRKCGAEFYINPSGTG